MDLFERPFGIGRSAVDLVGRSTTQALELAQTTLAASLAWLADGIEQVVERQLAERALLGLRSSVEALRRANASSARGMARAIMSSGEAFRAAVAAIDQADAFTRKTVLDNVDVASIVGTSFAGVTLSEIRASFRLDGRDATAQEAAERFVQSGLPRAVFCLPGLLSDESIWQRPGDASSIEAVLAERGRFAVHMRFNPGVHISDNGRAALELMQSFMSRFQGQERPEERCQFDVITFSLGGLILRSALYQARQHGPEVPRRLGRVVLVSSPDGGSYLEKLGFVVSAGLEDSHLPVFHLLGLVGNQRSDAIRDLSHGIIREEDWRKPGYLKRYGGQRYFGELDDVDAFQVYSLIYSEEEAWRQWIGDGIVEASSLTLLSEVYRRKGPSSERVHQIYGQSHSQVLFSAEARQIVSAIFSPDAGCASTSP